MERRALIILAEGAEEMEFVIAADVLRRAGISVTVAGLAGTEPVKCSRDVFITPDSSLESVAEDDFDVVVLPGGLGGSKALSISALVGKVLANQEKIGKLIAAICAAPIALAEHGICLGKNITSYPSFKEQLSSQYKYVDDQNVVQDGMLITSRGPGTAFNFALKVVEELVGKLEADNVARGMLLI